MKPALRQRVALLATVLLAFPVVPVTAEEPAASEPASLRVQVFTIHHRPVDEAGVLVRDFLGPQGSYKIQPTLGTITVEDESERIERIRRVLAAFDVAPPTVELTVHLIRASARGEPQESIQEEIRHVERSLRDLTRWTRFRRLGSVSLTASEGESVRAEVPDTPYRVEFGVDLVQVAPGRVHLAPFRLLREREEDGGELKTVRVVGVTGMNLSDGQMLTLAATTSERSPEALFLAMMARVGE